MPTADSFTALGGGNGFPACTAKVDVSVYDNWVTLGGVSSGSATQAQINTSLVNAMKLYWNLHSATASFTATWSNSSIPYSLDKSLPNHEYVIELEPKERLCQFAPAVTSATAPTPEELTETGGTGCSTSGIFKILLPVRMYDGSTSNESNFVGYGIRDFFRGSSAGSQEEAVAGSAQVIVASYLNGITESGQLGPDPQGDPSIFFFDNTASELILDGIPFRSFCSASAGSFLGSNISKNLISSANSASFDAEFNSGNQSISGSVTIPEDFGFDFYTY